MIKFILFFILIFPIKASIPFTADISVDQVKNTDLYQMAVDGDSRAQFLLASYYQSQLLPNNLVIVYWLKEAASAGNIEAHFALGKIYHYGVKDIPPSLQDADYHYSMAAIKGDLQAQKELDRLRQSKTYQLQSKDEVVDIYDRQWLEQSAILGDKDSQFKVGKMAMKSNPDEAVKWLEKAAHSGQTDAMFELAGYYRRQNNDEKMIQYYQAGCDAQDIPSCRKLYEFYKGTDTKKAIEYLEKYLHLIFPDVADLTTVSPELKDLKNE